MVDFFLWILANNKFREGYLMHHSFQNAGSELKSFLKIISMADTKFATLILFVAPILRVT